MGGTARKNSAPYAEFGHRDSASCLSNPIRSNSSLTCRREETRHWVPCPTPRHLHPLYGGMFKDSREVAQGLLFIFRSAVERLERLEVYKRFSGCLLCFLVG
jgi:hypothetical protein